jgi:hypothetical protein
MTYRKEDRPTPFNGMEFVCNLSGVREYGEEFNVELWKCLDSGRLVVRALNESGYRHTLVDLWDLMESVQALCANEYCGPREICRVHAAVR